MNSVVISGRFTKTPTLKYTNNKMPWMSFPLAVNSGKDKEAYFPNCKAFDKTAETIDKWAEKGKLVIIQGHIATGSYTGKDGKKVYTKTVFVESLEFAETKAEEDARRQAEGQSDPPPAPDNSFMEIPDGIDGELPFH